MTTQNNNCSGTIEPDLQDTGCSVDLCGDDWDLISATQSDTSVDVGALTSWVATIGIPASVPGDVHEALERAGQLPALWEGVNSQQAAGVAAQDWWYRKRFVVPEAWKGRDLWLEFDGVDYAAAFWLNGKLLGRHEGAFTPAHFRVNEHARHGEPNTLLVKVERAPSEIAARLENSRDQNGRQEVMDQVTRSLAQWKSRTLTGWDWGTPLWTMGIWKGVRLRATKGVRIREANVASSMVGPAYNEVELALTCQIAVQTACRVECCVRVRCLTDEDAPEIERTSLADVECGPQEIGLQLQLESPRLWWPNGAGPQHRYEARFVLLDHESRAVLDACTRRFGVRDLQFIENAPLPEGGTYTDIFTHQKDDVWMEQGSGTETKAVPGDHVPQYVAAINGRRVFACGANWLPADLIFGRIDRDRLEHLIRLSASCNINAFRVWGGGLIESEDFYELCDQYGIMVWQEMPHAGRRPLESEEALAAAKTQQSIVMRRLMNHPALIRYGFGNELYLSRDDSSQVAQFEDVCREIDPGRLCQAASPVTLDQRHGPHWFDLVEGYGVYNDGLPLTAGARFPAEWNEYGASGASGVESLRSILPESSLWPIREDDPVWRWHNGFDAYMGDDWLTPGNYRRLFGELPDLDMEVRASQWAQAEGLRYANQAHRRAMWQRSGCYLWTFNEPWPNAAHGCIVEYSGQPKMAYYAVKKSYASIDISARYAGLVVNPGQAMPIDWYVVSAEDNPIQGCSARVRLMGLDGGELGRAEVSLTIPAQEAVPVEGLVVVVPDDAVGRVVVLFAEVVDADGGILCNQTYLFTVGTDERLADAPFRSLLNAPGATLRCRVLEDPCQTGDTTSHKTAELSIENTAAVPALYIEVRCPSHQAEFVAEDNYFMLQPGETVRVKLAHRGGDDVQLPGPLAVQGWNTELYEVV